MSLSVVTAPTVTPIKLIGLDAAKNHVRAEHGDDDDLVISAAAAAWSYVERVTWRQLITATLKLHLDRFQILKCGTILIPRSPLQSISSIGYTDTDGNPQPLVANTDYQVDANAEPGRIRPAYGTSWPTARREYSSVEIEFVAGYGTTAAEIPDLALHAVRLLIGDFYENREPSAKKWETVDALLAPIRCDDRRLAEFV